MYPESSALLSQVGESEKKDDAIAHKYLLQLHRNYHTYYGSSGPVRPLAPNEVRHVCGEVGHSGKIVIARIIFHHRGKVNIASDEFCSFRLVL